MTIPTAARAPASERRIAQRPAAHFRPQVDGGLVKDGVCGLLLAEKLGVSQPTASEHLKILTQAGLLHTKRIKHSTSISVMRPVFEN
jgi:DNA-binding transcriptional ArsR family regulator